MVYRHEIPDNVNKPTTVAAVNQSRKRKIIIKIKSSTGGGTLAGHTKTVVRR